MKRIIILVAISFLLQVGYSQTSVGTPEQLFNFSKTTTYVVLESNPMLMYNIRIKEAVEKHWDLTDYEFVTFSSEEFEKVRKDPTKSFLITNTVIFEKDKTQAKYKYLYVQLGGDYEFVNQMPKIAGIPISYEGVDEDTYTYKLGMMVRFLQNHIKLTSQHPELNERNIDKYYYKNMTGNLQDKVLYVTKDDLAKGFDSMKDIKSIYPYKVELVTRKDIEEAIDNNDESVVFVHKVGPEGSKRKARCVNILVGAADANLYYFSWHMISDKKPEGLLKKDWKKLAKAEKKESLKELEKEEN